MNVLQKKNNNNNNMSNNNCTAKLRNIENSIKIIKTSITQEKSISPKTKGEIQLLKKKYEEFKTTLNNLNHQSCIFMCQNPTGPPVIAKNISETKEKQQLNQLFETLQLNKMNSLNVTEKTIQQINTYLNAYKCFKTR